MPIPTVYVFGHRNPDTDSVCAPYAYAWLKNQQDPTRHYQAGLLGSINPGTRFVFDRLKLSLPPVIKDVYPTANEVMLTDLVTVTENEPIGKAIEYIDQRRIRTLPVVDSDNRYKGIISMLELADYFMPGHQSERPHYLFRPENFPAVVSGFFLCKGQSKEFTSSLMVGAMAYDTFIQRLQEYQAQTTDDSRYPVLVTGNRMDIIDYALSQPFPAIILTGMNEADARALDTSRYKGWLFISQRDTSETIRILRTSVPVKAIANNTIPTLSPDTYLEDVKKLLRSIDHHGLAVLRDGKLAGLVSSSMLVEPTRRQVIMIDHNEPAQSAEGIEQADILEIIDHHRLGILRTTKPIYVYARPLGSSCTLVWQHFATQQVTPPHHIAALLLSGILTDTIILKSPTTTQEDVNAAEALSRLCGLDIMQWGTAIFEHAPSLANVSPQEAVLSDLKIYTEYGQRVGIAQMEVVTMAGLNASKQAFINALNATRDKFNLDWALLLITDIVHEESRLLSSDGYRGVRLLRYHEIDDAVLHLPGVLSRKKQLLPEVLRVMELNATNRA